MVGDDLHVERGRGGDPGANVGKHDLMDGDLDQHRLF
jgi:hypothetical protein